MPTKQQDDETAKDSITPDFLYGVEPIDPEEEKAMEDRAYSGAADDIASSAGLPSDNLTLAEQAATSPETTQAQKQEGTAVGVDDQVGKGYKGGDDKKKSRFSLRQKLIGGGGAGILIGGTFAVLSVITGPLQFVHIAQLLEQYHFSNQEEASTFSTLKMVRFAYYQLRGQPERTRLGFLGNSLANRFETKVKASGIIPDYTARLGNYNGYLIDPPNIPETSDFSDLKNKPVGEVATEVSKRLNIEPTRVTEVDIDGRKQVHINGEGLSYRLTKNLARSVLRPAGYSKVSARVGARITVTRGGGISLLHPIQRGDAAILKKADAKYAAWQKERRARISQSEIDPSRAPPHEPETTKNPDGTTTTNPQATEVAHAADDVAPKVPTETPEAKLNEVRGKLGKAAGVTAAIGIVCAVQSIAHNIDDVKQANVVLPLMRMAWEIIGVGNQVMSGQDLDMEQLSFYAKQFNDPATGSWANALSLQAEAGNPQTGPDIRPEAKIKNEENAVSQFLGNIPGLDGLCNAAGTVFGQIVTTAIGLFTGPFTEAAGQGFAYFVAPTIIEGVVHWLAGEQIDVNVAGADFGNYINYGARLASNDTAISTGGGALTPDESLALKQNRLETQKEDMKYASVFDRYFDPYKATSLVSKIIDSQHPQLDQNLTGLATISLKIPSLFASSIKSLSPQASAISNYDYGFPEFGFSEAELTNLDTENPYANAENVADFLSNPANDARVNSLIGRAKNCFGVSLTKDAKINSLSSGVPAYNKMPPDCRDSSQDWQRIRAYIFDSQTAESIACYEGASDCTAVGFGGQ